MAGYVEGGERGRFCIAARAWIVAHSTAHAHDLSSGVRQGLQRAGSLHGGDQHVRPVTWAEQDLLDVSGLSETARIDTEQLQSLTVEA